VDLAGLSDQETLVPALIERDEPRLDDLAVGVGEVGESAMSSGHGASPGPMSVTE
jgi:hypothetical protein